MNKPVEPWMEKASDEIFRVRIKGAIPQIIANHCPVVTSVVTAMLQDKDSKIAELEAAGTKVVRERYTLVERIETACPDCGKFENENSAIPSVEAFLKTRLVLPTLADMENLLIAEAMRRSGNQRLKAAKLVGTSKTKLYRKLGPVNSTEAEEKQAETAEV